MKKSKKIILVVMAVLLFGSIIYAYSSRDNIKVGATVCYPQDGCTGTSTAPSFGQMLVGNSSGTYSLTSTSSLGITAVAGSDSTWTDHNDYPAACGAGEYVSAIGDTLTCAIPATSEIYTGTVSTSSVPTIGNLSYWTAWNTLGTVATTSLTASSPLALSQAISVIGSSASALSLDTSGTWTGVAGTASALAADPSDCAANQFSNAIAANGNLTCAAIADADVPNTITASNYLALSDWFATTTAPHLTTLLGLTNATATQLTATDAWFTTIKSGAWNGTAIDFSSYTNATAGVGISFSGDAITFAPSEMSATTWGEGDLPTLTQVFDNSATNNPTWSYGGNTATLSNALLATANATSTLFTSTTAWLTTLTATNGTITYASSTALTVSGALYFGNDSIQEADIDFDTVCGTGNHLYVSGNDLACEADDDVPEVGDFDNFSGGRSLTYDTSGNTLNADAELYTDTRTFGFTGTTTIATTTRVAQWTTPTAITIVYAGGSCTNGTTTVQLDDRASTTPNTAGTNVFGGNGLILGQTPVASSTLADGSIATDRVLNFGIVGYFTGQPYSCSLTIKYTKDD